MSEPKYIRQNGDLQSQAEYDRWVEDCKLEAFAYGFVHVRISQHDEIPNFFLFEAWETKPADEGVPRWNVTSVEKAGM